MFVFSCLEMFLLEIEVIGRSLSEGIKRSCKRSVRTTIAAIWFFVASSASDYEMNLVKPQCSTFDHKLGGEKKLPTSKWRWKITIVTKITSVQL